ncbi:hypothetical protein BDW72DRAFT_27655 [Aspergillus terricola var. indicus]
MPVKTAIPPPQSPLSLPPSLFLLPSSFSSVTSLFAFNPAAARSSQASFTPITHQNHDALFLSTSTSNFLISVCFSVLNSFPACQTVSSSFSLSLVGYCVTHLYTFLHAIRLIFFATARLLLEVV